jgi:hypothetical protein
MKERSRLVMEPPKQEPRFQLEIEDFGELFDLSHFA